MTHLEELQTEAARQFISEHLHHDPATLMLQAKRYPELPVQRLVQQIQARQKAKQKLPNWAENPDLLFPPNLSVEQSSSEQTAAFKASLLSGRTLADLTGGFGIDSSFFAQQFEEVHYVEQQEELAQVAAFNFRQLGLHNITVHATSAEAFLNRFSEIADVFYLDPARRNEAKQKVHLLEDCTPDVLSLLPQLLSKSKNVLLKTSPMLDIDLALKQLQQVAKVYVVAAGNECKEVLYLLQPHAVAEPEFIAVNLHRNGRQDFFAFTKNAEETAAPALSEPLQFLYEPNAAILKAGAFKSIAQTFGLNKLHINSHLYTSAALRADFPGRIFKIEAVLKYNKKELLQLLPEKKASITARNFPDSVEAIRKKTGLKEGGDRYLFATTDLHQKPVLLLCNKV